MSRIDCDCEREVCQHCGIDLPSHEASCIKVGGTFDLTQAKPARYETRMVLAAAYIAGLAGTLTHAVRIDSDGEAPLCRRVKAHNIADPFACSEEELRARPTCPTCLRRDPRFAR